MRSFVDGFSHEIVGRVAFRSVLIDGRSRDRSEQVAPTAWSRCSLVPPTQASSAQLRGPGRPLQPPAAAPGIRRCFSRTKGRRSGERAASALTQPHLKHFLPLTATGGKGPVMAGAAATPHELRPPAGSEAERTVHRGRRPAPPCTAGPGPRRKPCPAAAQPEERPLGGGADGRLCLPSPGCCSRGHCRGRRVCGGIRPSLLGKHWGGGALQRLPVGSCRDHKQGAGPQHTVMSAWCVLTRPGSFQTFLREMIALPLQPWPCEPGPSAKCRAQTCFCSGEGSSRI